MKKTILISLLFALSGALQGGATLNNLYFGLDNMRGFSEVYWWFLGDGRVFSGLPTTGLTPADFETACKAAPSNCGTYTLSGDKLAMNFTGGQPQNWTYKNLNGGIQLNYLILTAVQKYPAGAHLNGKWNRPFSARTGNVSMTSPTFLSFKADGTFSENNVTGIDSQSRVKGASVTSSQASQSGGTYTIKENVLMLVRNGKSERHMIFPVAGDNLNIDGVVYKRSN